MVSGQPRRVFFLVVVLGFPQRPAHEESNRRFVVAARLIPRALFPALSRWDVIEAHDRATSTAAARFLHTLQQRLPFPVRALQVDGGSEFAAAFEDACQQRGRKLFVLPPRSPQLNGAVERAQPVSRRAHGGIL